MICDICNRKFDYCFYINDEYWFEAVGKREGHWCAHCILEKLHGREWYILWNEPVAKSSGHPIGLKDNAKSK